MTTHREIETKHEVDPGAAVPDPGGLPGVADVQVNPRVELEAVYFDTADLRLASAGITLRRRTGGDDAGWHLKLPVSHDERIELQRPLTDGDVVPAELEGLVRARVRRAALLPVAVVHTVRTVRELRDGAGAVLAEVADDVVTSRAPRDDGVHLDSWREWEVELVGGDRTLLGAASELLEASGATRPARASKLARALGTDLDAPETGPSGPRPGTAGAALITYLRAQRDELLDRDPQVRGDEPDGVHQMRVATRRIRSALATGRRLLDRDATAQVRGELRWLGGLLGAARDAEVARAGFAATVARQPVELVLGPVAQRLDDDRGGVYRSAHAVVLEALDSERYLALLDAVDALVNAPPLTPAAEEPADRALPALVRRDFRRLTRAMAAVDRQAAAPDRDHLLHEARKAAKSVRYAAELAAPTIGTPAEASAERAKKFASLLGDHHDSVEARAILRRVGVQAHLDGQNAFTYGRLHALAEGEADRIEAQLPKLWRALSRRRRRAWMR